MRGGPLEVITRLLAVPIVMVPAKTTVVTDDRSQAITTIADYGGELLQGIAIATTPLTDSHGSPATTITVQIHTGMMVVETLTNPKNGEPTTTVILFSLVPNIPGSILANIVVTTSTIYFLVYFLPVFLIPIQAIDVKIKLLRPFCLLTRSGGRYVLFTRGADRCPAIHQPVTAMPPIYLFTYHPHTHLITGYPKCH